MNQNRNNNRRRGRGNNRGAPGGGSQGNRIDSRARGNAPQMLEKYRKMAHDASLNGDRVQTEFYLQFADHYFRVVADSRVQRDDQRPRNDREQQQDYEFEDGEELGEAGGPPPSYQTRRERAAEEHAAEEHAAEGEPALQGERIDEAAPEAAAEANPFVREDRGRRPRQQRNRGDRSDRGDATPQANAIAAQDNGAAQPSFDASVLPPAIVREGEEAAPRRTRTRRPRRDDGDGGEALEAVG